MIRQWLACLVGKHFWVEFEPEGTDDTFVYCLYCGCDE